MSGNGNPASAGQIVNAVQEHAVSDTPITELIAAMASSSPQQAHEALRQIMLHGSRNGATEEEREQAHIVAECITQMGGRALLTSILRGQ